MADRPIPAKPIRRPERFGTPDTLSDLGAQLDWIGDLLVALIEEMREAKPKDRVRH